MLGYQHAPKSSCFSASQVVLFCLFVACSLDAGFKNGNFKAVVVSISCVLCMLSLPTPFSGCGPRRRSLSVASGLYLSGISDI